MAFLSKRTLLFAPLFLVFACGSSTTENRQGVSSTQTAPSAASSGQVQTAPVEANGPANSIPDFTFYILKSGMGFEKSNLLEGKRQVFILFDPSCSFCQHEAAYIGNNIDKFTDINFYFISMNDPGLMSTFFDRFAANLNDHPNVFMLYDRNVHFINRFHMPSQFPATYIYDENGLLKDYWNGIKTEEELVSAILK